MKAKEKASCLGLKLGMWTGVSKVDYREILGAVDRVGLAAWQLPLEMHPVNLVLPRPRDQRCFS